MTAHGDNEDPEDESDNEVISIQAAINSLTGIHASVRASSKDVDLAHKEANAGLRSSKAKSIINSMTRSGTV